MDADVAYKLCQGAEIALAAFRRVRDQLTDEEQECLLAAVECYRHELATDLRAALDARAAKIDTNPEGID